MSDTQSSTPRTDALEFVEGHSTRETALFELARQLERELAEARAEIELLKDRHRQSPEYLSMLEAMLAVKSERDQLRAQLSRQFEALKVARDLLSRCRPVIESDALMMADITRHAPLDPASQAIHDSTEYESERLAREIPIVLTRIDQLTKEKP